MEIEFDLDKDAINQAKHRLSLADAARLDWSVAVVLLDTRRNYDESRYRAYGFIDGRLHMVAFTMRGATVRPISFRKANRSEVKRHG